MSNHRLCLACYNKLHPNRTPVAVPNPKIELCCSCAKRTTDGIYYNERANRFRCGGDHGPIPTGECVREGCTARGRFTLVIQIRPFKEYKGLPIIAMCGMAACEKHRAWFLETSGQYAKFVEAEVRKLNKQVDPSLTRIELLEVG